MGSNRLDAALAAVRRAHDDIESARVEFRRTLNLWASEKSQATADAHARARDRLNAAVENLRRAERERAAARAEVFQLQP
jgi:hypothetical protein